MEYNVFNCINKVSFATTKWIKWVSPLNIHGIIYIEAGESRLFHCDKVQINRQLKRHVNCNFTVAIFFHSPLSIAPRIKSILMLLLSSIVQCANPIHLYVVFFFLQHMQCLRYIQLYKTWMKKTLCKQYRIEMVFYFKMNSDHWDSLESFSVYLRSPTKSTCIIMGKILIFYSKTRRFLSYLFFNEKNLVLFTAINQPIA